MGILESPPGKVVDFFVSKRVPCIACDLKVIAVWHFFCDLGELLV